eukprot:TRINITY_DN8939_c0_g2_i1.p1 TRINITY_DN8939_c0_g2~~TRINITY_DN8939_c0_g2_i1.p1  ORF type:complete len:1096 (-),score=179.46 TRINITY_DN8939_c0_g2_i1:85-3102(-)
MPSPASLPMPTPSPAPAPTITTAPITTSTSPANLEVVIECSACLALALSNSSSTFATAILLSVNSLIPPQHAAYTRTTLIVSESMTADYRVSGAVTKHDIISNVITKACGALRSQCMVFEVNNTNSSIGTPRRLNAMSMRLQVDRTYEYGNSTAESGKLAEITTRAIQEIDAASLLRNVTNMDIVGIVTVVRQGNNRNIADLAANLMNPALLEETISNATAQQDCIRTHSVLITSTSTTRTSTMISSTETSSSMWMSTTEVAFSEFVEDMLVQEMMQSMQASTGLPSDTAADNSYQVKQLQQSGLTLKVWMISPESVHAAGGRVRLDFDDSGTSVEVTADTLLQVRAMSGRSTGHIILSMATSDVNEKQDNRVSVNFRDEVGRRLKVDSLRSPVLVILVANLTEQPDPICVFLDVHGNWSSEGLVRAWTNKTQAGLAEVACSSTHLTIFATALASAGQVFECSSLRDVFSAEGMAAAFENLDWLGRPAPVLFVGSIAVFIVAVAYAAYRDHKSLALVSQGERLDIIFADDSDTPVHSRDEEQPRNTSGFCSYSKQAFVLLKDVVFFFPRIFFGGFAEILISAGQDALACHGSQKIVMTCIAKVHTYKSKADTSTIAAIKAAAGMKQLVRTQEARMQQEASSCWTDASGPCTDQRAGQQQQKHRSSVMGRMSAAFQAAAASMVSSRSCNSAGRRRATVAAMLARRFNMSEKGVEAFDQFTRNRWWHQLVLLFPAIHPWLAVFHISIFNSHASRAALIMIKLVSCAAGNAFFSDAQSLKSASDPRCEQSADTWVVIIQAATRGISTALLGDLLVLGLWGLVAHSVTDVRDVSLADRVKLLRQWWIKDMLFWILWSLAFVTETFYCMVFLANVSEDDQNGWLIETAFSFLEELVLLPVFMTLLLGVPASIIITCQPNLVKALEEQTIDSHAQDGVPRNADDKGRGSHRIEDCDIMSFSENENDAEEPGSASVHRGSSSYKPSSTCPGEKLEDERALAVLPGTPSLRSG